MPGAASDLPDISAPKATVKRRQVFYVSGFDPRGARWYHRLFRREARKYPANPDFSINAVSDASGEPQVLTWTVSAREGDVEVETVYSILDWEDIVRSQWPRGRLAMLGAFASNFAAYLGNGTLAKLAKTVKPTFVCGVFPTGFVFALLIVAALLGGLAGALAGWLTALFAPASWAGWAGWVLAAIFFAAIVAKGLDFLDRRFKIFWLNRIYRFNRKQALGQAPGLEQRIDRFARIVQEAAARGANDEILIVAHSTGCQIAVSALARAIAGADPASGQKRLSFLTLGNNMSMLALQPEAGAFRDDIRSVAESEAIDWIDFSIPSDGACFALYDPLAGAGIAADRKRPANPKLLNVRVFKLHPPESLRRIGKDKLLLHFQYIMAPDMLDDYDFFRIVAGGHSLHDRYAHRPSVVDYSNPLIQPYGSGSKAN